MSISPNRLKELQNIPDTAIDTSDIPELDRQFWKTAKMVKPVSQEATLIQLDRDILDWFKSKGKGYSGSQLSEVQEPHPQPPPRKRGGDYDVPHVISKRYTNL